jgi:hypothetical protein
LKMISKQKRILRKDEEYLIHLIMEVAECPMLCIISGSVNCSHLMP